MKSRYLDFFLTAGFYFWRETNLAIIPGVCLKDWISCKWWNPVLSFLFLLCSTDPGLQPLLRPPVAKTKDNKKLELWAGLTRRLFVMTRVKWSVRCVTPPHIINDLTLHSSSQTRVPSASLITARCGPESRGLTSAHSRIREHRVDIRSPVTSESEWADICQKGAICECLSVIRRTDNGDCNAMWGPGSWSPSKGCDTVKGNRCLTGPGREEERAICWYFMIIIFNWAGRGRTHARLCRHTSHFWESSGPGAGADCIVSSHQMAAWLLVAIKTKSAPVTEEARREWI